MKAFLNYESFTIPANGSIPRAAAGSVFICKESSDQFQMRFDSSPMFPMEAGLGFRLEQGEFRELFFSNNTASDITVEYYAGDAQVIDARLNTIITRLSVVTARVNKTNLTPYDLTINAGSTSTIAQNLNRKQIIITNLDPNLDIDLQIAAAPNTNFDAVFARSKWTAETTAGIRISNGNGSPVNVRAVEITYF